VNFKVAPDDLQGDGECVFALRAQPSLTYLSTKHQKVAGKVQQEENLPDDQSRYGLHIQSWGWGPHQLRRRPYTTLSSHKRTYQPENLKAMRWLTTALFLTQAIIAASYVVEATKAANSALVAAQEFDRSPLLPRQNTGSGPLGPEEEHAEPPKTLEEYIKRHAVKVQNANRVIKMIGSEVNRLTSPKAETGNPDLDIHAEDMGLSMDHPKVQIYMTQARTLFTGWRKLLDEHIAGLPKQDGILARLDPEVSPEWSEHLGPVPL
jgi:hypothetical protein